MCRFTSDVFYALDDPAIAILRQLVVSHPQQVWEKVSKKLIGGKFAVRHRIDRLIEPPYRGENLPGVLFGLPSNLYLDWVRHDPKKRASVVLKWLPVTVKLEDGALAWHPAKAAFVDEFAEQDYVLGSLGMRLYPKRWWGSIGPFLEALLPLLATWERHPKYIVRQWVNRKIGELKLEIAAAKKESEEVVRFS